MTAQSTSPTAHSPSRRALLAGLAGAIGALAASAAGRVAPVRATNGDTMHVGDDLAGTSTTKLTVDTADVSAFWGNASATSGTGIGLRGDSFAPTGSAVMGTGFGTSTVGCFGTSETGVGVQGSSVSNAGVYGSSTSSNGVTGSSSSGPGVYGDSTSDTGVFGSSAAGVGVQAHNNASNLPAILGWSKAGSTGVHGASGSGVPPAQGKTGVYGSAEQASGKGVWGNSGAGHGIHGESSSGYAGYFVGKVYTTKWYELTEVLAPSAPSSNRARLFIRDNGSGKTQLCVRFAAGAIQVLATQP